ncbi:hypothetical protein B6U91_02340 [Candidatus Pacearchaeota archaeon ex4484_71]|nr:MAG: hypothetical protein B6U91_02340 [Candidatus Pacearchaeota archaeon ex4484_71]
MKEHKFMKTLLIFILVVLQIGLTLSLGDIIDLSENFNLNPGSIAGVGIEYSNYVIRFVEDRSYLKIGENLFIDILPKNEEGDYSEIVLNEDGTIKGMNIAMGEEMGDFTFENILFIVPKNSSIDLNSGDEIKGTFRTSDEGGNYSIDGNEFEVKGSQEIHYSSKFGLSLGENTKIKKLKKDQQIDGSYVKLPGGAMLSKYGACALTEDGYLLKAGGIEYSGTKLEVLNENKNILLSTGDKPIPADYKGGYVKINSKEIKIKSTSQDNIRMSFLTNNNFFDTSNDGLDENAERTISIDVKEGDTVSILKEQSNEGIPKIQHEPSENHKGSTKINTGRQTLNLYSGKLYERTGNLNTRMKYSTPFILESPNLKSDTLKMEGDNGYYIYGEDGKPKFTFNKELLDYPNYKFKSKVGEEIYSFAEDKIGNSAYVHGGRGQIYYSKKEGKWVKKRVPLDNLEVYDCIGLVQSGLVNVYGGNYNDFPADLKLENSLTQKGWKSYVIEPSSASEDTENKIKKIPAGSIVFLMHNIKAENLEPFSKNIDYVEYTNSNKENLTLFVGHTLIKGKGNKNFINAIPRSKEIMPKKAREYNERLEEEGKEPIFLGATRRRLFDGDFSP